MVSLNLTVLVLLLIACAVVALLIGFFVGSRFGGKKSVAMREATEKHDTYKNDVREHFEQTSAIMSRMVEDYRDMYEHMAEGADKLGGIHPEKQVTPPPAPEAITRSSEDIGATDNKHEGRTEHVAASDTTPDDTPESPAKTEPGSRDHDTPNRDAVMNSDSSNDRPWNKEKNAAPSGLE